MRNRFEALGDRGSGGRTTMILSTYSKPRIGNKPWEKSRKAKRRNRKWRLQDRNDCNRDGERNIMQKTLK